jgi:L-alanine-DL-glutamate epimerase-like enolase superfamily enzyme
MVRAFYYGWYGHYVTELPPVEKGMITIPKGNGIGTKLQPDVMTRKGVTVKRTTAKDL